MGKKIFGKRIVESVIQRLLFEYPLYNYIDSSSHMVNVLVVGDSKLCFKFVDVAFEMCQVSNFKLNITLRTDDCASTKELYLSERPAFDKFFAVDRELNSDDYGVLNFASIDELDNGNSSYSYVFVDLNDDTKNKSFVDDYSQMLDGNPMIAYMGDTTTKLINTGASSVKRISSDYQLKNMKSFAKIKEMAFNCHLIWNSDIDVDFNELKKDFYKAYNFYSNISLVLSIKYKLNSIGISIDDKKAGNKLTDLLKDDDFILDSLAFYEHRRWNINRISDGYDVLDDLDNCPLSNKTVNPKRHACLVKSVESNGRALKNWGDGVEPDVSTLDDLDKVSYYVHKSYSKRSAKERMAENRKKVFRSFDELENMPSVSSNTLLLNAIKKYRYCVQDIFDGQTSKTNLYTHFYQMLIKNIIEQCAYNKQGVNKQRLRDIKNYDGNHKDILDEVPDLNSDCEYNISMKAAKKALHNIMDVHNSLRFTIKSGQYHDFKVTDYDLIEKIPFILNYSKDIVLGLPLGIEEYSKSNQILFENAASTLYLSPKKVVYFYDYKQSLDMKIISSIKNAIACFKAHNRRAKIDICLLNNGGKTDPLKRKLQKIDRIDNVCVINYASVSSLYTQLNNYINKRNITFLEMTDSRTSSLMRGLGIYDKCPYYRFVNKKQEMVVYNGADVVSNVPFKTFLRVSDLFEFKNSTSQKETPNLQREYEVMYEQFKYSSSKWKAMCRVLAEHDEIVISTRVDPQGNNTVQEYDLIFNEDYYSLMMYLVEQISERYSRNFEYDEPEILGNNYKVHIKTIQAIFDKLNEISNDSRCLDVSIDNISVEYNASRGIVIRFGFLYVNNLFVGNSNYMRFTLNKFNDNHIISLDPSSNGQYVSFKYFNNDVRDAMTIEGKLLEIYIYYKALEQGFDDVATSAEVFWQKDVNGIKNEFDIVLTNGFKSVIIEAKAKNLNQDYLFKLSSLADRFGINCTPVIISSDDTQVSTNHASRGNQMGVKVWCGFDILDNIGNSLKSLLV